MDNLFSGFIPSNPLIFLTILLIFVCRNISTTVRDYIVRVEARISNSVDFLEEIRNITKDVYLQSLSSEHLKYTVENIDEKLSEILLRINEITENNKVQKLDSVEAELRGVNETLWQIRDGIDNNWRN